MGQGVVGFDKIQHFCEDRLVVSREIEEAIADVEGGDDCL